MRVTARGGGWPDEDQLVLLHAVLDEPPAAAAAWERWSARHDGIGGLPDATRRLLPQLARRLAELGAEGPLADAVRERLPHAWTRNRMLLRAAGPALRELAEAGLEPMAIKGAAIAAGTPGGFAIRPMFDLDLLVRPERAERAGAVLAAAGFEDVSPRGLAGTRPVAAGAGFRAADGSEIDLHWRPVPQPGDCLGVWERAVPAELGGAPVLVPAPEDMLVHACAHGLSAGSTGPRWVADAVLAHAAAGGDFDWHRLVAIAAEHRVGLVLEEALRFLDAEGFVEVPGHAFGGLAMELETRGARITHALLMRPALLGPLVHHLEQWDHHRRGAGLEGARPSVWRYLGREAERMGVGGRRGLMRHWLRRGRQRLAARRLG